MRALIGIICLLSIRMASADGIDRLSPNAAIEADRLREYETRVWPTAEEVLSGELDRKRGFGRDLDVEYVTDGFQDYLAPLPEPGVHPRIILSPEDIQQFRRYLLMGEDAPDFFKREMAILETISRKANPARTDAPWNSPTVELARKALYALITEDPKVGREAVVDLMDHARYMDRKWDEFDAKWAPTGHQDQVYDGPHTHNMGLGMTYDYAYAFMTEEERAFVRGVIAKATGNRYISFMENPDHFNNTNHLAFAQNWWVESLAIEGEEGWDPRVREVGLHKVEAYINAVVSKKGFPFEGVKPSISPYAMMAAQRRGHRKVVQSDHLQAYTLNLLNGLYWTWDRHDPTKGKWHGRRMNASDGDEMGIYPAPFLKFFYREDVRVDTAWQAQGGGVHHGNVDLRLLLGESTLYAKGWQPTNPELPATVQDEVPLTWVDPERGVMRTRGGWGPDDILLRFEARDNYYSAGHEAVETFAIDLVSHGVDWTYYPGRYQDSRTHGTPQIDGKGPTSWQPIGARIVSVKDTPEATALVADATDEFNWVKREKTMMLWHPDHEISNAWLTNNGWRAWRTYEVPFLPGLKWYYEGFGHPEWGNWHGETRGLEYYELDSRSVDMAMRTVHLARGHFPYILILDDLRMDEAEHQYEFILKAEAEIEKHEGDDIILTRGYGTARLLVRVLHTAAPYEVKLEDKRLTLRTTAVEPEFRILVYPHRVGDVMPQTEWNPAEQGLSVTLPGQEDTYAFRRTDRGRTVYTMNRNARRVLDLDVRPAAPVLADADLWMGKTAGYGGHRSALPTELQPDRLPFDGKLEVALKAPTPGTVIRYTTDGTEPGGRSELYAAPITVEKTTTLKARAFGGDDWPGVLNSSELFTMTFEKRPGAPALNPEHQSLNTGLVCELFEVYQTIFNNETGLFTGKKVMLPELNDRQPLLRMLVKGLETPRAEPVAPVRRMSTAFYRYRGYLTVPADGTYRFRLYSPGPVRLTLGGPSLPDSSGAAGQTVIENTGVYYNAQRYRYGVATLKAGAQAFELVVSDPEFFLHSMTRPLEIRLDMAAPGAEAFVPVDASAFAFASGAVPMIEAEPVNVSHAEVAITCKDGRSIRYTVEQAGLETWPVSQAWPTAASPVYEAPLTLDAPGHYVVTAAAFDEKGQQRSEAVQKRIAVLPEHALVDVTPTAPGLLQATYTRVAAAESDYHALALAELELNDREPLQQVVVADVSEAENAADKPLLVYTGYFEAAADGIYRFDLEHPASRSVASNGRISPSAYRLQVAGQPVAALRIAGPDPLGAVYLKQGRHPVRLDLVDGKIAWNVLLPGETTAVPVRAGMLSH